MNFWVGLGVESKHLTEDPNGITLYVSQTPPQLLSVSQSPPLLGLPAVLLVASAWKHVDQNLCPMALLLWPTCHGHLYI